MFCHKCGQKLPADAIFCQRCGTRVVPLEGGAGESAPASAAEPVPPAPKAPKNPKGAPAPFVGTLAPESQDAVRAGGTTIDPRQERDVWTGGYSAKDMALAFIGLGSWTALIIVLAALLWARVPGLVWLLLIGGPALYLFGVLLYRKTTIRYRLTNQRFFYTHGFLVTTIDEMDLARLDDVTVEQNLIGRLFDVGTLVLHSTDRSTPVKHLRGVSRPREVKEFMRTYMVQLRQGILRVHSF